MRESRLWSQLRTDDGAMGAAPTAPFLEPELRSEFNAQVVVCTVVKINEIAGVYAQADATYIKLGSRTRIKGAVRTAVAELADRACKAIQVRALRDTQSDETTLNGSEDPRVLGSARKLGPKQTM